MTAGHDGYRGLGSQHCGALDGAMTVRIVPTQVLTICRRRHWLLAQLPFALIERRKREMRLALPAGQAVTAGCM
jgi:hypothetical protein